jgi:hypothetical protein
VQACWILESKYFFNQYQSQHFILPEAVSSSYPINAVTKARQLIYVHTAGWQMSICAKQMLCELSFSYVRLNKRASRYSNMKRCVLVDVCIEQPTRKSVRFSFVSKSLFISKILLFLYHHIKNKQLVVVPCCN